LTNSIIRSNIALISITWIRLDIIRDMIRMMVMNVDSWSVSNGFRWRLLSWIRLLMILILLLIVNMIILSTILSIIVIIRMISVIRAIKEIMIVMLKKGYVLKEKRLLSVG